MYLHPRRFFINPINRNFWWGVGSVGLAWLFRRRLRPIAVQGAKGLVYVTEGVKNIFNTSSESVKDIVIDAQTNRMRDKMDSLDLGNKDLGFIKQEISKLSQQLNIMNKVMTEQMTKEKEE